MLDSTLAPDPALIPHLDRQKVNNEESGTESYRISPDQNVIGERGNKVERDAGTEALSTRLFPFSPLPVWLYT